MTQPTCIICGENDPRLFYAKNKKRCKDCVKRELKEKRSGSSTKSQLGAQLEEVSALLRHSVPQFTNTGRRSTRARDIDMDDYVYDTFSSQSDEDSCVRRLEERMEDNERDLDELDRVINARINKLRDDMARQVVEELDEMATLLRNERDEKFASQATKIQMLEEENSELAEIIKVLDEKLALQAIRLEQSESKMEVLGAKFEERIKALEERKTRLLDKTVSFDDEYEEYKAKHDGKFYASGDIEETLFYDVWKICCVVINVVESMKRDDSEFIWDDELFSDLLGMNSKKEQEQGRAEF